MAWAERSNNSPYSRRALGSLDLLHNPLKRSNSPQGPTWGWQSPSTSWSQQHCISASWSTIPSHNGLQLKRPTGLTDSDPSVRVHARKQPKLLEDVVQETTFYWQSSHSAIWRGTIPFYSTLIHLLISLSHLRCWHTTFGTWDHLLSKWENACKSIARLLTCVCGKHLAASLDKHHYQAVMLLAVLYLITGKMNDRAGHWTIIHLGNSNQKWGTFKTCLMVASSGWTTNGFPMLRWVEPMASCFSPTVRVIFFIDIAIVAVAPVHKMD